MTHPSAGLLGAGEIRRLAESIGLRPTKTLGQNFVHDANTVRRIVALAEVGLTDHVIEVGPGLGSLTLGLLGSAGHVTAVEIDPRLAALLPDTVATRAADRADRLTVRAADALHLTVEDLPSTAGPPTALVANLPYNVGVPVLLHLLATLPSLNRVLVMVQAEVADRLSAGPGSKTYGVPSVKLAYYGTAARSASVSRTVFWPVPRVDSALVTFTRTRGDVDPDRRDAVFAVIDAAFAQRRKTLRAALSGWAGSAAAAEAACVAAGIDPAARAETLPVAAFEALAVHRSMTGPDAGQDR